MRRSSLSKVLLENDSRNENNQNLFRMFYPNISISRILHRRNFKSFITGLLIFFLFFYIFLSFSTRSHHKLSKAETQFPDENVRKSAFLINQQLEKIEVVLKSNRLLINEIRDEINKYEKHFRKSVSQLSPPITSIFQRSTCSSSSTYSSSSSSFNRSHYIAKLSGDINMLNVYENLTFDNPDGGVWKQGWPITLNEDDFSSNGPSLKIIVMPHSHNDPGWIKTFDTYFQKQTKLILDSAIDKLTNEPSMKFVWAESSYLSQWMSQASENDRTKMINLVRNGQIEIVTGGWVMNDEANSYYFSILSQLIDGHEFLEDTFGIVPKHGWANDPFGLSPTMAYFLKKMGFRAMVIQRVHYSIKKYLAQEKNLEFHWRQSFENHAQDDILCHLEPFYSYDVPHTCGPDPKICCQFDFKRLPGNKVKCPWKISPVVITEDNIAERASLLLDQYRKKSKLYRSNVLLVPLGDDFRYDSAKEWNAQFDNYKRLFDYMNANETMNVEIKFGTLSDYFDDLFTDSISHNLSHDTFPSLVGDFFTYADRDDHYWSGYYTSKPFYKRFERVLQSHLRATEILFSVSNILASKNEFDPFDSTIVADLQYARQNLALFQHHDGITGTAKDFVVRDYASRMFNSFLKLQNVVSASLSILSSNNFNSIETEFMNRFPNADTPLMKKTFDSALTNYFVLYNTLGSSRDTELICFNVQFDSNKNWCLKDTTTNLHIVDVQINHIWTGTGSFSENTKEVCFQPTLNQLSLKQYCVGNCDCDPGFNQKLQAKESIAHLYNYHQSTESIVPSEVHILSYLNNPTNISIKNDKYQIYFDPETGHLISSKFFEDSTWNDFSLNAQLMIYGTRKGGKSVPKSGAYIFLPDQRDPVPFTLSRPPNIRVINGPLESRIEIITQQPIMTELRFSLVQGGNSINFDTKFHLAGFYAANREFLVRFGTKLNNRDVFFTDLNGFQLIKRKFYEKIPIQGNVYPFNTMSFIEDDSVRMNVLTAQPLGVTVSKPGMMDIFLDRRLSQDDDRGLGQGVVDNKFTQESFRIYIEKIDGRANPAMPKSTFEAHHESLSLLNPVLGIVSKQSNKPLIITTQLDILTRDLPCDIHLLNFRRFTKRSKQIGLLFHRTDHQCQCEKEYKFSLNDIFVEQIIDKLKTKFSQTTLTFLSTINSNYNLSSLLDIDRSHIVAYRLFNL